MWNGFRWISKKNWWTHNLKIDGTKRGRLWRRRQMSDDINRYDTNLSSQLSFTNQFWTILVGVIGPCSKEVVFILARRKKWHQWDRSKEEKEKAIVKTAWKEEGCAYCKRRLKGSGIVYRIVTNPGCAHDETCSGEPRSTSSYWKRWWKPVVENRTNHK